MSVRRATQLARRATRLTFWDLREYKMSNLPPSLSDSTSASGAQGGAGQPAWPHPEQYCSKRSYMTTFFSDSYADHTTRTSCRYIDHTTTPASWLPSSNRCLASMPTHHSSQRSRLDRHPTWYASQEAMTRPEYTHTRKKYSRATETSLTIALSRR